MPNVFEALENFTTDRPIMKESNSDLSFMVGFLLQEIEELRDEPHGMSEKDYLIQEASDVAIIAISILNSLTKEPEKAIMEKVARNTVKYPAYLFQSGDYEEAVKKSKQQWTKEDNERFYG